MPQTPQKRAEQLALSGQSVNLGELESVLDEIATTAPAGPAAGAVVGEDDEMAMLMAELRAEEERAQRLQMISSNVASLEKDMATGWGGSPQGARSPQSATAVFGSTVPTNREPTSPRAGTISLVRHCLRLVCFHCLRG